MHRAAIEKRIFVVGCPRSGTTLLQSLLLNVPGTFSMPETNFFGLLANSTRPRRGAFPPRQPVTYPRRVSRSAVEYFINRFERNSWYELDQETKAEVMEAAERGTLTPDLCFDLLMTGYASADKQIILEKTPAHAFHVPYIKSLFPDALFIGIIRDPRDVYASFTEMLRRQCKPKRTVSEFALMWNSVRRVMTESGVDIVRYESLVEKPRAVVNDVLSGYGLSITAAEVKGYHKTVTPAETAWKRCSSVVYDDRRGVYPKALDAKETAEIQYRCSEGMDCHGYAPDMECERSRLFALRDSLRWQEVRLRFEWRDAFARMRIPRQVTYTAKPANC